MTREELVKHFLRRAQKGAHREDMIVDVEHLFTMSEVAEAFRECRKLGMYSVPGMRSIFAGTYYQFDGEVEP